jgi:hypothetical protein
MQGQSSDLTMDELRARIKVAGIQIVEARLHMVRDLVNMGLRAIRMADSRAMKGREPAITFEIKQDKVSNNGHRR